MEDFFDVKTVEEARRSLLSVWLREPLRHRLPASEKVGLVAALGRVLTREVASAEEVPPHPRSTVDGFALRSRDTFGASESLPAVLKILEDIPMGSRPELGLSSGTASRIPTGGFLPEGADACVMVEYTESLEQDTVLIHRAASPGENVIQAGEDVAKGEVILRPGTVMRSFDIGALAAIGVTEVDVLKKPIVAVISTGDEIVPPTELPRPGQMRDINTYSLSAAVAQSRAIPLPLGISIDEYSSLRSFVEKGLDEADMVLVSGGSSVGVRDATVRVFTDLGPPGVLVHGVAVRPGKPVILGICRGKPVFGLPGHPVSALTAFDLFVRFSLNVMATSPRWYPLCCAGSAEEGVLQLEVGDVERVLAAASALSASEETWVEAHLGRNVSSTAGRQDHVRVRLTERDGRLTADPVLGKSGLISVLSHADGEVVVPLHSEGIISGTLVKVRLFPGRV